jgi:hypothetical protein
VSCVRPGLAAGHRPSRRTRIPRQRIPERLGIPGIQADLMLSALRPEADSAFGLAAEARSQGAGRQDEASDSDPLTLAEYVTHCPKISVR